MNLGIDNNIFFQPFSLIVSLMLFIGCYQAGEFIISRFNLKKIFLGHRYYKYFAICLSINLIMPFSHLFLLIGKGFKLFGLFLGIYLFFFFCVFIKKFRFNFQTIFQNQYFLIVFVLLLFLSSLGPITNADSLDYHAGVGLYALNYGVYPDLKLWLHSLQAGAGESLIALSFFFKSEQLASLIQFSGILPILGVFHFILDKYKKTNSVNSYFFVIILITCPIIIQLVTTIKPQFFYTGVIFYVFALIFYYEDKLNALEKKICYFIIFLFLGNAFLSKYYFLLSSAILILFFLFNKIKSFYEFRIFILFGIISFIILILPTFLWKNINYNVGFIQFFTSALPTEYIGYDALYRSIISDGTNFSKISFNLLQIIFPLKLIHFTQSLGLGVVLFLFIKIKNINDLQVLFISILYILTILFFGQQESRFLLEPYLWLAILAFKSLINSNNRFILFYPLLIQPIIISITLIFFIFYVSAGSLSENLRTKVLEKSANGYSLSVWANKHIKRDEVAIYTHRSISTPNFKVIPSEFLQYINFKNHIDFEKSSIYFKEIKDLSPNYIVFYGEEFRNSAIFNCTGELYKKGNNIGKLAVRNFVLNNKFKSYNGYIYHFDSNKFPGCLKL